MKTLDTVSCQAMVALLRRPKSFCGELPDENPESDRAKTVSVLRDRQHPRLGMALGSTANALRVGD